MLKIKHIEFIKVVYDESMSHNIFSIANITFSNYEPIYGALLYWCQNTTKAEYTPEGDYKFFYDMEHISYFASVKFPKNIGLTRDQKQELAYILLEERGSVGSYSFPTHKSRQKRYNVAKEFKLLNFPTNFYPEMIDDSIVQLKTSNVEQIIEKHPSLTKTFIKKYITWRYHAAKMHPADLETYLPFINFHYICLANPFLSEKYLIHHLDEVSPLLQYNYPVLNRLSSSFKRYLIERIKADKQAINPEFASDVEAFIEDEDYYKHYEINYLDPEELEEEVYLQFFEYDIGPYKWAGSEHLIKGIPSLACQIYDQEGFKKPSIKEMDLLIHTYSEQQLTLLCAILEPHWLHRYRNELNWATICRYNSYLSEDFIMSHIKFIDFDALGDNKSCELSEDFLYKYMKRFNHQKPVPLVIRNLTVQLYIDFKDTIKVDLQLLEQYGETIDEKELALLQNMFIE
ncbi:nucleoside-diphosphate sugar epimerase [Solibacillus sp. CAU 1738]|uniref:nucleoside-diphosphate sugar epimerase n=1 Tax=Solibacillus sp. CAU 1738 TaxID=3140363 RepID=UPI00326063B2